MITAIVPARSGSKRLPGKNMLPLNGKPLVFHTIDAVLGHHEISRVIYSTDSSSYADAALEAYESKICVELRPDEYAKDDVKVYDEILRLANCGLLETEWFMLCLPTAPLRSHEVVRAMLEAWSLENASMFSACAYDFPVQFAFKMDDLSEWRAVFPSSPMVTGDTRSQDIEIMYRPNGATYIGKTSALEAGGNFYAGAKAFIMNKAQSIDIDDRFDLMLAESVMKGT